MTKRTFVILILLCSAYSLLAQSNKSNLLFIIVDDLRPELNCYGESQIKSPNIDKLASEGFLFENAYCQVPVCGASRASFLSGLRPERNRFVTYGSELQKDAPNVASLPKYLKDNGYTTISNGKVFHNLLDSENSWSEHPFQPKGNWRDYQSEENKKIAAQIVNGKKRNIANATESADVEDDAYWDGIVANKTMDDLQKVADSSKPFALFVGFRKPHLPFNAPKKYWDLYNRAELKTASNPFLPKNAPQASYQDWGELRAYVDIPNEGPVSNEKALELIHGYYAAVSYSDAQVGKVLSKLKQLGLDKNTLVILIGDHGWQLGEHAMWCKHCNYKTSLNAPMIIRMPNGDKNKRVNKLVEYVDLYPTVCDYLKFPLPEHLQGNSLMPILNNTAENWKTEVYSRFHDGESVTTPRYTYTEYVNDDGKVYARMLYDHQKDPDENENVAEVKEYKTIVEYLSEKLLEKRNSYSSL